MGCFTVLKSKKKKRAERTTRIKYVSPIEECISTALPEPQIRNRTLQSAPSSFNTRVKPINPVKRNANDRTRALSAPSALDDPDQDPLASEYDDQEDLKYQTISMKDQSPGPQPLPLPSSQAAAAVLRTMESFKNTSGPLYTSGPLPLPPSGILRNFSYEEIAAACHDFSPERCMSEGLSSAIYRASFRDDFSGIRKNEATVTSLHSSIEGVKEFVNKANTLASLQHPNICKLLGFHAREGSDQRMLVYERLFHGSLDRVLYGRSDGPLIDWTTRMKIALCAAQGLTFLHEEGPFHAMYNEFSTANIQIDKDFSARLSGYGCVSNVPETEISNSSAAMANLSVETLERGLLTPKSNVWSFGIILLELLTGRKSYDNRHPIEERNLVKWSRPFLSDDSRLSLIMDPQLKGRYPTVAARTVADMAQRCLQKDSSERPTMRSIVENLKTIQDMKHSCRYPLQDPARITGKQMLKSPSMNVIMPITPKFNSSSYPPARPQYSASPVKSFGRPLSLPPRSYSTLSNLSVLDRQESRKSTSSASRRASSVEGY